MSGVGVLGGTFDPIHLGHLAGAEDAAAALDLDRVLFVPNHVPPHKTEAGVSPARDRIAMVRAAIADNPLFALSLVEMERPGPSYTLETMRALRDDYGPSARLIFLAGSDALNALHRWHRPYDLLAEFEVAFLCRPGDSIDWPAVERHFPELRAAAQLIDIPQLEISSQDIRQRVREGRPIRYYVVPAVADYIRAHGLYRA